MEYLCASQEYLKLMPTKTLGVFAVSWLHILRIAGLDLIRVNFCVALDFGLKHMGVSGYFDILSVISNIMYRT